LSDPYVQFAGMYLQVRAQLENERLSTYETNIGWDEITQNDKGQEATALKTTADAITELVNAGIVSLEAGATYVRNYIDTMLVWQDEDADNDELRRVVAGLEILRQAKLASGFGGGAAQADNQPSQEGQQPSQQGNPTGQANTAGAGGDVRSQQAVAAGRNGTS
jgi:hypothetical protein